MSSIPIANMPKGIDVSKFQRDVDWPTVVAASGISFAFARVIDDKTGTTADPFFARNFQGIKAAGILRGVYHIFNPRRDPRKAANLFVSLVGSLGPGDLQPTIDVELDGSTRKGNKIIVPPIPLKELRSLTLDGVAEWIDIVEAAFGRQVIIYTFTSFWRDTLANSRRFSDHPLWIASLRDVPDVPEAFPTFTFHQHSDKGKIRGIPRGASASGLLDVDLDRFNGSMNGLRAFADLPPLGVAPVPKAKALTIAATKSTAKRSPSKKKAAKPGKTKKAGAKKKSTKKGTKKAAAGKGSKKSRTKR